MKYLIGAILILSLALGCKNGTEDNSATQPDGDWLLAPPAHGYVTSRPAAKWEESMLTGNGTIGALVPGDPLNERLILSHEKLFMPQYPPYEAPDLGAHLEAIRRLVLEGKGEEAAALMVEAGREVGIDGMIWTNPLVPACQLEMVALDEDSLSRYNRSVNYETGEASTAWQTERGIFYRRAFTSRPDEVIAVKLTAADGALINTKIRLAQLPVDGGENAGEQEFAPDEVIEEVQATVEEGGRLKYLTRFKKKWEGSLKGYVVETIVRPKGGNMQADGEWLTVREAEEVTLLSKILLSYDLPLDQETEVEELQNAAYDELLARHSAVHGELFNRFSVQLGEEKGGYLPPEELQQSSSVGNLNKELVEELCQAARYILISSTGELPPSLQGIWGGTWMPAWSGDFTLNGNVPSAIASGLNTNFPEVTEAYMNYMYSMFDDFKANAEGLYGAPGIFVPSRSSSSGSTYHYGEEYPHLFWFAGNAWTAQFFYDYWQYTGDEQYLKEKVIPFMLYAMAFYEFILTRDEEGKYMFNPSYSPEVAPVGEHPLAINATMDIAALKQLIRNLLTLAENGYLETEKVAVWKDILENLPDYAIDESGDLKEWIWPGLKNNNAHRHASHLYPLFYEVDPEFEDNPALMKAAETAIDNRMEYRRANNGAEMAFGLAQKGLAAAHMGNARLAYECVDYLCNVYWSPAFTSYHDPGEIFNVDISGGLPAVVAEMIIQSSADEVLLLPALPSQWPDGEIKGVGTRSGATIDLVWKEGQPVSAKIKAGRDTEFQVRFKEKTWDIALAAGGSVNWKMD